MTLENFLEILFQFIQESVVLPHKGTQETCLLWSKKENYSFILSIFEATSRVIFVSAIFHFVLHPSFHSSILAVVVHPYFSSMSYTLLYCNLFKDPLNVEIISPRRILNKHISEVFIRIPRECAKELVT